MGPRKKKGGGAGYGGHGGMADPGCARVGQATAWSREGQVGAGEGRREHTGGVGVGVLRGPGGGQQGEQHHQRSKELAGAAQAQQPPQLAQRLHLQQPCTAPCFTPTHFLFCRNAQPPASAPPASSAAMHSPLLHPHPLPLQRSTATCPSCALKPISAAPSYNAASASCINTAPVNLLECGGPLISSAIAIYSSAAPCSTTLLRFCSPFYILLSLLHS